MDRIKCKELYLQGHVYKPKIIIKFSCGKGISDVVRDRPNTYKIKCKINLNYVRRTQNNNLYISSSSRHSNTLELLGEGIPSSSPQIFIIHIK